MMDQKLAEQFYYVGANALEAVLKSPFFEILANKIKLVTLAKPVYMFLYTLSFYP